MRNPFALSILLWLPCAVSADEKGIDFFENRIRPILVKQCYRCHSTEAEAKKRLKGNLYLDSKAGMLKGGDTGPAVVPNDVRKSLILTALRHENKAFEMPPKGKLDDRIIADFAKWIEMGAPDPREKQLAKKKYEIDLEAGRKFWSMRPLQKVTPPKVADTSWPRNEVDQFILAKLESASKKPAKDVDSRLLVRRIYFDLIGLPPSPKQIDAFIQSAKKDRATAIAALVDELLKSPRFGERWGRHWLDVARYAESNGGTKSRSWPDAWRYRDYVIDSFNNDKPYHLFVREQIAGDLLPSKSEAQRHEQKIATAFLAMGSKEPAVPRMEIIGEQLDVLGRAFLGLSIGCARCHDHKFDPVPTRDFYSLAGVMLNTQIQDGKPFGSLNNLPKSKSKGYKTYLRNVSTATRGIEKARDRLGELTRQAGVRRWPGATWEETLAKLSSGRASKAESSLKELRKFQADLKKLREQGPPPVLETLAVVDRAAKGRNWLNAKIHIRGSEQNLGEEVPRGVLQVLMKEKTPEIGENQSGRLQVSEIIHRHPLTARVMVNRVWHHLFGTGIVRTVDNLGTLGERPTHPNLLEWLASGFVKDNWSIKRLIRRIMLSRAYQVSRDDLPRRLDAESIRDAILTASGKLDLTPPDRFDSTTYHALMADITAVDRINKRAVYLPVNRGLPTDVMAVFNFPPADLVVGRREAPSVPTQALFLLNSPLVLKHSQWFALRLLNDPKLSDGQRIDRACEVTWGRPATEEEKQEAIEFLNNHQKQNSKASEKWRTLDAWSAYCQSLFCAAEFRFVR